MSETVSASVTITNKLGLHARPAMLFVETASQFKCAVTVGRKDQAERLDGKSIMQMLMLAATQGTELEINATGPDAEKATKALIALVKAHFHED